MLQLISLLSNFYKFPDKLSVDKLTQKALSLQKLFNAYGIYRINEMIEVISKIRQETSCSEFYGITALYKDIKNYLIKNKKKEEKTNHNLVSYLKSIKFKPHNLFSCNSHRLAISWSGLALMVSGRMLYCRHAASSTSTRTCRSCCSPCRQSQFTCI